MIKKRRNNNCAARKHLHWPREPDAVIAHKHGRITITTRAAHSNHTDKEIMVILAKLSKKTSITFSKQESDCKISKKGNIYGI